MASREPLLDTNWLLGLPDHRGLGWRRFLYQLGIVLLIVMIGVGLWPTLSKAWVQSQLTQQYQSGSTLDSRNAAMVALAEMLPESLPVVMAGLSNRVPEEAQLAFQALDYYIGQLTTLSVEQRRGAFAELIHALEETTPSLTEESIALATSLAARVTAVQQSDQHPGTVLTLAACQRILTHHRSTMSGQATGQSNTHSKLSDLDDLATMTPKSPSVAASLSDVDSPKEQQASQTQTLINEDIASVDQPTAPVRMSLKSNDASEIEPLPLDSVSATQASANAGQLRQKLLRANRFIPVSGSLSVPIQSGNATSNNDAVASNSPNESIDYLHESPQNKTRAVSSNEEVIGIGRWKTEDLLPLLSSVTPRLASAAFHELQSRLSQKELELAVELAQGTAEQRVQAMENLIHDSHLDPLPWLTWMGNEADRDVRFKAVSLLGSINNEDSRLRLRVLHGRERDAEISRHIQSALLASGSVKPLIR
jgi:hypothetical protein